MALLARCLFLRSVFHLVDGSTSKDNSQSSVAGNDQINVGNIWPFYNLHGKDTPSRLHVCVRSECESKRAREQEREGDKEKCCRTVKL